MRVRPPLWFFFFFFNDPPTTEIYPLPLHDALPIFGRKTRLALLGDHALFAPGDLAKRSSHRTAVAAGPDDDGGLEHAALAHDANSVRLAAHRRHAGALSHVGAGGPRAVQQVVIELPPDDAVAGRRPPAGFVACPFELEPAGGEGLGGERGLCPIDVDARHRPRRDPAPA